MVVKLIFFFLLCTIAFCEEDSIYKLKCSIESDKFYTTNSIYLKNFYIDYKTSADTSLQELSLILKNKSLHLISDDIYCILNYNCEIFNSFSNHLSSYNSLFFEPKIGIYINNNFYLSFFSESIYRDYYNYRSNSYFSITPKATVQLPLSDTSITLSSMFRFFTLNQRQDYKFEGFISQKVGELFSIEAGDYILNTNNIYDTGYYTILPDTLNERVNHLYCSIWTIPYDSGIDSIKFYFNYANNNYLDANEIEILLPAGVEYVRNINSWIDSVGISYQYDFRSFKKNSELFLKKNF